MAESERPKIGYSCYFTRSREGEQFVPEHVFSYQLSGRLTMTDNSRRTQIFNEGDFRFIRRNNLVKYIKEPAPGGEFKSVSIYLDQQSLRNFSIQHAIERPVISSPGTVIKLKPHTLYRSYMDSLQPYRQDDLLISEELQQLKVNEAILILLQTYPTLAGVLFDFSDPGKIDLEGFMEKNFHFNVQMKRFAYLTGRSLATFKRDFEKIFKTTPGQWLQQRRLQEAYYLIKEKGQSASDIYLDLGFEDLSHFSYAFKNKFGLAPSKL
ncbi:helix-turn-helix transcriptional regulator [Mucilaginibacter robiniae]|uniref:Helix-turn-helix transcriptional regulator n=1 Tax=Mucilaginibacter robiniae TaxID=2728022 RepID=A0A7L5E4V2_9SPHI|nr:AraC family transcriptional regulator [Mucilaginibacter robiniae]QJD97329.1 helix-turn-helix transcriptional regulator [Mucilaginibacter robiniae]